MPRGDPTAGRAQQEGGNGNCLKGWVQEACRMGLLWKLNSYLEDSGKMVSFIKNTLTENVFAAKAVGNTKKYNCRGYLVRVVLLCLCPQVPPIVALVPLFPGGELHLQPWPDLGGL